ncbi:DUF4272 domain-containing protein [Sphingomonas hankookensis]|uniref:DUF4272 domain-containing protein n=1 Tax=Sphingomonas hankookensis TaxID=563996 RepID=UPI00234F9911|nr:DUF4272 domain-containing protein [Sphingomonas hankookensis]WCP73907.1 DUF4272 domain-containing protein [Sphingomonas hankookensis]
MSLLKRLLGGGNAPEAPASAPVLVNAYATLVDLPPLDLPHRLLGARDRSDPELAEHLRGFVGYVMSRGDGQMTATRYYVWRHLQRVRHHVSFEIDEAHLGWIEPWAKAANALLFLPDGSVRAPDGAIVIDAQGEGDPDAAIPFPDDAVARRPRTRAALADAVLQPPAGMAPALGAGELVLRAPEEVLHRALALLYLAARAHARATGLPAIPAGQEEHNPLGAAALTPQERAFLADEGADADAAAGLTWRYEAANSLLWALGVAGAEIDDSSAMADVDRLWASVAPLTRGAGAQAVRLRPASEILDALDRTWLEHWIVRQARQKEVEPGHINGDVVVERHVALNWLTNFQNEPEVAWDDTDTPT